jgi:hypothetical protein
LLCERLNYSSAIDFSFNGFPPARYKAASAAFTEPQGMRGCALAVLLLAA